MKLSTAKWVLLREDSSSHEEIYFVNAVSAHGPYEMTRELAEAKSFDSAAAAYKFAKSLSPMLDWRHVGLRA